MKLLSSIGLLTFFLLISCSNPAENPAETKELINGLMNNWHKAAADARLEEYIRFMDKNSIYIGTDANEIWTRDSFNLFCKPYFAKGTTWDFKTIERNVYLDKKNKTAWFDELLKTKMGVCRGSGILIFKKEQWRLKHYVLSMTIPNDVSKIVTVEKMNWDSLFIAGKMN